MVIAHICPRYYPYIGGVETHVKEIAERLTKHGLEVEVLTTDPKGDLSETEVINGVTVKRFHSWAPNNAYFFSTPLNNYLKRHSADYEIVHAHSYHAFPSLYAALNHNKNRLFFTPHYHGEGHTPFRNLLFKSFHYFGKKTFSNSEKIIAVSNYEKGLIQRDFKINEQKIDVIPNGINKSEFKSLVKKKSDYQTILSVGRVEEYKGMHHLVHVLTKLDEKIKLTIVGRGTYSKNLLSLIRKLGLIERVDIFHNLERKELLNMYANADLFALLSRNEAYGICVAEALAAGTPCVVAKMAALSDWVDECNCFGVDYPIDYSCLKNVIEKAIGRKVSDVHLLDWDEVTEKLLKTYRCYE